MLNLLNGLNNIFHNPKNEINYIYKTSNHPPSIIKLLPLSAESQLSKLSSGKTHLYKQFPLIKMH